MCVNFKFVNFCIFSTILLLFQIPHHTSAEPHYSTPVRHRRNLSVGTSSTLVTNPAININTTLSAMDDHTKATLLADDLAVFSFLNFPLILNLDKIQ